MAPHRALLRSVESRFMAGVPLLHPVLDVGCGDGHFASVTYTERFDVGLDPWERDLKECAALRRGLPRSRPGQRDGDAVRGRVVSNRHQQ